ncbi:nitroreductase family protein [Nannocystaceae bacterium ST9]
MTRTAQHPIEAWFLERWSARALSGEPLAAGELERLFEAARWAPSSMNGQPWRFLYARAGSPAFATFFDLLVPGNQAWCVRASALLVVVSKTTFDNGNPARTHSFDAGAAWMSLALQGSRMGLVVHGMQGFDYDAARSRLGVPEDHDVECMIAVGKPGKIEDLPEGYRAREQPSDRKPIEAFAFEGAFPGGEG